MKKSRYTEEQIIGFLKQAEAGMPIKELCRNGGFSDATFHKWSGGPTQHERIPRRVEFSTGLGEGKAPAWMLGFARRPLKAMALRTQHVGWTSVAAPRVVLVVAHTEHFATGSPEE